MVEPTASTPTRGFSAIKYPLQNWHPPTRTDTKWHFEAVPINRVVSFSDSGARQFYLYYFLRRTERRLVPDMFFTEPDTPFFLMAAVALLMS